MVVIPLYLGLVLSGESPSSMAFLLLLFDCCGGVGGSICNCSCSWGSVGSSGMDSNRSWSCSDVGTTCNGIDRNRSCSCCSCCSCCCCSGAWGSLAESGCSSDVLSLVFNMWGLSRLTSESRTGFKKNSSAPSSKHLFPIRKFHPSIRFKSLR